MGIGAAASEPATLSMIRHIYPDHKARARALGAWAAVSGLALAMGPVIGGILVGIWSWRAVFWFNLVFGALAFIVAAIALPESVNAIRKKVDFAGFFFAAVILGTATFACIQGELTGLREWLGHHLVHRQLPHDPDLLSRREAREETRCWRWASSAASPSPVRRSSPSPVTSRSSRSSSSWRCTSRSSRRSVPTAWPSTSCRCSVASWWPRSSLVVGSDASARAFR